MVTLKGYLWSQRWNILFTTQVFTTCGIVYQRYCDNQEKILDRNALASTTSTTRTTTMQPLREDK
uniref:Secreted protein n=1 Tax=Peronospora matthiolae TaxID=2874970 RepID=A0AAV1UBA9_9STRA